jgi:hypothetical protein
MAARVGLVANAPAFRIVGAEPLQELVLSREPKSPSPQAGIRFEKAQKQAREGEQAMADYHAAGRAADAKIARLRALRLAKEAADREAADEAAQPVAKKQPTKPKKKG